jgi:hypothetical protein
MEYEPSAKPRRSIAQKLRLHSSINREKRFAGLGLLISGIGASALGLSDLVIVMGDNEYSGINSATSEFVFMIAGAFTAVLGKLLVESANDNVPIPERNSVIKLCVEIFNEEIEVLNVLGQKIYLGTIPIDSEPHKENS